MSKALIVGATGLVGSEFTKKADSSPVFSEVVALVRRKLNKNVSSKTQSLIEPDSSKWSDIIKQQKNTDVFFSALATTRGAAGGFENQYKIDHDLNLELAKAAKEAGFKTYVIISSAGANKDSRMAYLKMKGELDEAVAQLKFPRTIIVRPGVLLGERDGIHKGFGNNLAMFLGKFAHGSFLNHYTLNAIEGSEIAEAVAQVIAEPIKGDNEVKILNPATLDSILKSIKK